MIFPPAIPLLHIVHCILAHAVDFERLLPCGEFPEPDEVFPGLERGGQPFVAGGEGVAEGGVAAVVLVPGYAGEGEECALCPG